MTCENCPCPKCVEAHGLFIPEDIATPTPEELITMLEARGWSHGVQSSLAWTSMLWGDRLPLSGVFVPMRHEAPDYRRAVRTLLAAAAIAEGVPPQVLLDAVLKQQTTPENTQPQTASPPWRPTTLIKVSTSCAEDMLLQYIGSFLTHLYRRNADLFRKRILVGLTRAEEEQVKNVQEQIGRLQLAEMRLGASSTEPSQQTPPSTVDQTERPAVTRPTKADVVAAMDAMPPLKSSDVTTPNKK